MRTSLQHQQYIAVRCRWWMALLESQCNQPAGYFKLY